MRNACITIIMFFAFAMPALAADTPLSLYAQGNYEAAIKAGEAKGDAESLVIATRAALSDAKLRDAPCAACFKRVEALAKRAIAADPKRPEPYIYLASAMGSESHAMGALAASAAGMPGKSKKIIDTAASLAPDHPLVLAGIGGWNIEVIRVGGGIFGQWFYAASFDAGVKAFKRAIALAPGDLIVRYEFALQLAAFDAKGQRGEIAAQLAAVSSAQAPTAYEKALQARAKHLSDLLAKDDLAGFSALVRRYQNYPS